MLLAAMPARLPLLLLCLAALAVLPGCGKEAIDLAKGETLYGGATTFNQRCGGCHTIDAAGTEGSASNIGQAERKDGPNFNQRKEQYEDVLYAIQNGGFSSGPMPQNIVTGRQAREVACFVAVYSGKDAKQSPSPGSSTNTSKDSRECEKQFSGG